jgi:hypothetical protein
MLDSLLAGLAEQGKLLGILCAIFILAIVFLFRSLMKAKDQSVEDQKLRLEDQKAYASALEKGNEATQKLTLEIKEFTSDLMVKYVQERAEVKNVMTNQTREFDEMEQQHRRAQDELKSLTAAINQCKRS